MGCLHPAACQDRTVKYHARDRTDALTSQKPQFGNVSYSPSHGYISREGMLIYKWIKDYDKFFTVYIQTVNFDCNVVLNKAILRNRGYINANKLGNSRGKFWICIHWTQSGWCCCSICAQDVWLQSCALCSCGGVAQGAGQRCYDEKWWMYLRVGMSNTEICLII